MGEAVACKSCQKSFGLFRWRYICDFCEKTFCSDCLKPTPRFENLNEELQLKRGKICPFCQAEKVSPMIEKYNNAMSRSKSMEVVSTNYKGNVAIMPGSNKDLLCSDWIQYKDNAITRLKVSAAYLYDDCDLILNLECFTQPARWGNYKYTAWQAKGMPAKKV